MRPLAAELFRRMRSGGDAVSLPNAARAAVERVVMTTEPRRLPVGRDRGRHVESSPPTLLASISSSRSAASAAACAGPDDEGFLGCLLAVVVAVAVVRIRASIVPASSK